MTRYRLTVWSRSDNRTVRNEPFEGSLVGAMAALRDLRDNSAAILADPANYRARLYVEGWQRPIMTIG